MGCEGSLTYAQASASTWAAVCRVGKEEGRAKVAPPQSPVLDKACARCSKLIPASFPTSEACSAISHVPRHHLATVKHDWGPQTGA